jgi:NAD-dependent SIR2 family protein deacetylase
MADTTDEPAVALASLINLIRRADDKTKKLKIILGDGYDPTMEIAHPKQILARDEVVDPHTITPAEYAIIWSFYEYARLKTYNQCPDRLLYYLLRLAQENILSTVVTTNYDCYWASVKQRRASAIKVSINPVNPTVLGDLYYDPPTNKNALKVFVVHGRLDYVRFGCCGHRFPSPLFSFKIENDPKIDQLPIRHCWFEDCNTSCSSVSVCRHDIDWLNEKYREPYQQEITAAIDEVTDPKTTAGVLVLGFVGYCSPDKNDIRRQEDLVPALERIATGTEIPIWVVNTTSQYESIKKKGIENCLAGKIKDLPNVYTVRIEEPIRSWFGNALAHEAISDLLGTLDRDFYKDWVVGKRFMPRDGWQQINMREKA